MFTLLISSSNKEKGLFTHRTYTIEIAKLCDFCFLKVAHEFEHFNFHFEHNKLHQVTKLNVQIASVNAPSIILAHFGRIQLGKKLN